VSLSGVALAAVGLITLVLSGVAARGDEIPAWERRAFHAVNRAPDALYPVLWLPMQLGNLVVGTAVGVLIAVATGDGRVAVGVVLAAGAKLLVERLVRREMHAHLAVRTRPGTSQTDAVLRGDVPTSGASFPSGHVILVAAISAATLPIVPPALLWAPVACVTLTALGRVYVGAHNPLDVTAGIGAGLLIGGVLLALSW
jgi:membrane-associated phospholipid phosphatase